MGFLTNLNDRLTTMEQEVQALPEELDSIIRRLNRDKLENVLVHVNEDFNKLLDDLSTPQTSGIPSLPLIFNLQSLSFTSITSEDRARWRSAQKSKIRVVIGKGKVQVMAASEVADKQNTAVSRTKPVAQQKGYIVLNWDQYQTLLNEIDKLIIGND